MASPRASLHISLLLGWMGTALPLEIQVPAGTDTLARALEERRILGELKEDVDFILEPGFHRWSEPVSLAAENGGSDAHRVRLLGINATVSGGVVVRGWTRVNGSANLWRATFPAEAAGDLQDLGSRMQLWRGLRRYVPARSALLYYEKCSREQIVYRAGDVLPEYHDQENVLLVLYNRWTATFNGIGYNNVTTRTINLTAGGFTPSDPDGGGSRYYISNAREHLDEEGEFYADLEEKAIYIYCNASENPNNSGEDLVIATNLELLRLEGNATAPVRNVHVSNVTFAHTAVESAFVRSGADGQSAMHLTTAAVALRYAENVTVEGCTIRNTGGYALWSSQETHEIKVSRNSMFDLGAGGIRIGRDAAITAPEVTRVHVSDNVLSTAGGVWQMGAGIIVQRASEILIEHNSIQHFRYTGISVGWTWGYIPTHVANVTVRYNYIHDIGMGYLSDMGCVYTLGYMPGSMIHNNICSDVQSYGYGGWGYYTDEGTREAVFTNNIAVRTKCAGQFQHYGTDNVIENNIYYNVNVGDRPTPGRQEILMDGHCDGVIRTGTSGRDIATCSPDTDPHEGCCCYQGCDMAKCSSFTFRRNIVYELNATQPTADEHAAGARTSAAGDAAAGSILRSTYGHPVTPSLVSSTWEHGLDNFTFDRNVYFAEGGGVSAGSPLFNYSDSSDGKSFAQWQAGGKDADSVFADPLFADPAHGNFSLAPSSPALSVAGFEPIDTSTVGPRGGVGAGVGGARCDGCRFRLPSAEDGWVATLRSIGALG